MVINNTTETPQRRQAELSAPPAARLRRARWHSPQIIVGALLVLVPVVIGARVVAAANDTQPVLVAAENLSSGQPLAADMLEIRHVALDNDTGLYFTEALGEGHVVLRDVREGELLPRSVVVEAEEVVSGAQAMRYLTLSVPAAEAPAGLSVGDAVDVWLASPGDSASEAEKLAPGLTVAHADDGGALGLSGSHATVTLVVQADDPDDLEDLVGQLIAASRDGSVYLSKLPGRR
ncbi:SAF domain-containing protein [Phytoactinopolyspora mesophila]|uniref:SAF domain-containing protein n=1 Tax=Phytoactinopolyspora mesophila TaxID=2650750 RepID=A0A7K3M5I9_9ACTN|nr:SAF domain-containing protein [Phytoactinopolyspora mesophila]NDL58584.1 hypothetical protein [Phytoactinopolyspora mesophila]